MKYIILSTSLLALCSILSPVSAADIKCWTNEEGVTECGNFVPPKYSQEGHEVLNERGIVVKKVDRAKTQEELAAERKKQEDAAEAERKRKEDETKVRALLDLFSNEDDIIIQRDARLATIDAAMNSINSYITSLDGNLNDLEKSLEQASKDKKQIEKVNKDITEVKARLEDYHRTYQKKQQEKLDVVQEYDGYLIKYREVKKMLAPANEVTSEEGSEKPQ